MTGPPTTPPHDDALSLAMFWAGALMAFTPLVCAAAVLAVWWRKRSGTRGDAHGSPRDDPPPAARP